jgi:CTP synthase (UTP-ammonia lyase)
MIIEYARNVLGYSDAEHAEYNPYASNLFVTRLDCSLVGRDLEIHFASDSFVARCYCADRTVESYYCNFGVDSGKVAALSSGPLKIVGADNEGAVRVVELPGHPFFIGTLFVPQIRSTASSPHPLITAFIRAAARHSV